MGQRLAIGLTAVNLILLVLLFTKGAPVSAQDVRVLRGSALEIVDGKGRVRLSNRDGRRQAMRP
jgi:hypothetical protein